jgi:hypothetical protein
VATTAQLLDLDGVSVRAEKVRFDICDTSLQKIGELHPEAAAQIDNSATQQIKRRLSSLRIASDEYADVNPLADRIRPYWVLENGDELPLGVFLFADASTHRYSYGLTLEATCVDQGLILSQQLAGSLGFASGASASDAISQTFEAAGIFNAEVDVSQYTFGSPTAYPTSDTYAKVLDDLCLKAGYHSPYFDNDGNAVVRTATDLSTATATLNYLDGGRIVAGSIVEANDLLGAPNRFLVVDTAATTGVVSYALTIPADAPHSYQTRGWYLTHTIEAPGVGNVEQAQQVAEAFYRQNPQAYETAIWSSPGDPRHDTFDVVNYRGVNYLEVAWSLRLAPGGPMTHKATRVYV